MRRFWIQTGALLRRNFLLKSRKPAHTFQEILYPVIFMVLLLVLSLLIPSQAYPPFPYDPPLSPSPPGLPSPFYNGTRVVAYAPGSSPQAGAVIERALLHLNASFPLVPLPLGDEVEIEAYFLAHPGEVWAGVTIDLGDASHPAFRLRMNVSELPSTSNPRSDPSTCRTTEGQLPTPCPPKKYLSSGFLSLQLAINQALLETVVGVENATLFVSTQQMPKQSYQTTNDALKVLAAIYSVVAFSPFLQSLLVNLVAEKELHVLEAMVTMGMSYLAYQLSWILLYSVGLVAVGLALALILVLGGVLPSSNIFLVFLLFLLYTLSLIALGFLLAPFFSNSKIAGAVGVLLPIVCSMIYLPIAGFGTPASAHVLWGCSFLSPVALPLALSQAVTLEYLGYGLTFDTLTQDLALPGFSVGAAMLMLLLDIIAYLLLAWYLENILPSVSGIKLPPWFPFLPTYWFPTLLKEQSSSSIFEEEALDGVEPVPDSLGAQVAIEISGIKKTYTSGIFQKEIKEAVKGISLKLFENQIFGLLGHNGAGKSTFIKMLCGVQGQTSGSMKIFGYDTRTQMPKIRSMIGLCPQENILFDQLTVKEHLNVFAGLRGLTGARAAQEVTKMIADVDLVGQEDVKSLLLSGGQKRKLCLGMALIGDPKVVFLDEPTAGVDPLSRRKIWEMLQLKKKGHVILLTTHSMDEADLLCERKAIVSHGQIRCVGSSLFLKSRFGLGYRLTLTPVPAPSDEAPHVSMSDVHSIITSFVPDATLHHQQGALISYTLPIKVISLFPALFASIERDQKRLGIQSYVVSMTTLEEVFLNLEHEEPAADKNPPKGEEISPMVDTLLPPVKSAEISQLTKFSLLFKYRLRQILRNRAAFFFSVIFPIYSLILGLVFYKVIPSPTYDEVPITLSGDYYSSSFPAEAPLVFANATGASLDSLLAPLASRFLERSPEEFYDTFNLTDQMLEIYGLWGPSVAGFNLTDRSLDFLMAFNASYTHSLPIALQEMANSYYSLLAQEKGFGPFNITAINFPFPFKTLTFDSMSFSAIMMIGLALVYSPLGFASDLVKERQRKIKHQLLVQGVSPAIYWLSTFARDGLLYCIPAALVVILMWAFQVDALTGPATLFLVLLLIAFLPTMLLFVYLLSLAFTSYESAQAILPLVANFMGLIPYMVVASLDLSGVRDVSTALHFVIAIWNPPYAVMGGLHFISMVHTKAEILEKKATFADYGSDKFVIPTIVILLVEFWILLLVFYFVNRFGHGRRSHSDNEQRPLLGSPKINSQMNKLPNVLVSTKDLKKEYTIGGSKLPENIRLPWHQQKPVTKKVAVSQASFEVDKNECFGLLGPNGAGKTSLMKILTGTTYPTNGEAQVAGFDITHERSEAFKHLGYCPQHDALFDDLTILEHLDLYGRVKGIPLSQLTPRIKAFISLLGIEEHEAVEVRKLSGGTKRKLSFAIALIADPSVVILDEPSAGMDPASRRKMWGMVRESVQGKACLLTTHSMEEAEELCTKIGIFIKGHFECIGTTQDLKDRYGGGYQLDVKVPLEKVLAIQGFLKDSFGSCDLIEEHYGRMTFRIQDPQMPLSEIFGLFEKSREEFEIEDYSLSQPSLEQVFLSLAKKQQEE